MQQLRNWLAGIDGFADADIALASGDASFRRYFRANSAAGTFIVMDAPPSNEDCARFIRIAGYLGEMSLNCPTVLQSDIEQGFLLLTDLGSQHYLDELTRKPQRAAELYADALATIHTIQREGRRLQTQLPVYDEKLLRFELGIFREWLCERHLGIQLSSSELLEWERCCGLLVDSALAQPRVFVHRDYHSRNLMLTPTNNPGILDFQDAVEGPLTYDLVSLLRDCYLSWPEEQVRSWALDFYRQLPDAMWQELNSESFMRSFDLMGAQRHLKAAGIFARLLQRDGKPAYMNDVPRTLRYVVALRPRHRDLEFVATLIEDRCLPLLEEQSA